MPARRAINLRGTSPTGARYANGKVAQRNNYERGVSGRAANGQSLQRLPGETMGEYIRRTGESTIGGGVNKVSKS